MLVQVIQAVASHKETVLSGPYFLGHDCSLDRLEKLGWELRRLLAEAVNQGSDHVGDS